LTADRRWLAATKRDRKGRRTRMLRQSVKAQRLSMALLTLSAFAQVGRPSRYTIPAAFTTGINDGIEEGGGGGSNGARAMSNGLPGRQIRPEGARLG
jgi:hypothetical protein